MTSTTRKWTTMPSCLEPSLMYGTSILKAPCLTNPNITPRECLAPCADQESNLQCWLSQVILFSTSYEYFIYTSFILNFYWINWINGKNQSFFRISHYRRCLIYANFLLEKLVLSFCDMMTSTNGQKSRCLSSILQEKLKFPNEECNKMLKKLLMKGIEILW